MENKGASMLELFNDLKELMTELSQDFKAVEANVERVQTEALKAERVSQDIQRKVTEFKASTQPRIEKINEILDKITKKAD
ncbi:hypothetical protein [Lactococcus kimchii]|uniref:hypothetical protein n=1 Tax=Lactococcus sp. S-13 TaxID=2507158 RepID=UPI001CC1F409|nr:hypothetical protein [Lactococcus sp. S-13]